jgi:hypothetical protein
VDGARDGHIGGPAEALSGVGRQLDLDDDDPDRDVAVEQDDDHIGAVFGRLDLGQVGRDEAGFRVGRKREAQHLDQDFGGERRTIFEEISEDLVSHRRHWRRCSFPENSDKISSFCFSRSG